MRSLTESVANVTVAVERALARGEVDVAASAVLLLYALRGRTGQLAAVLPVAERVVAAGDGSRRAEVLSMRGRLRTYLHLDGAEGDLLAAAALAREQGREGQVAMNEAYLALCRGYLGPVPRDLLGGALERARRSGDPDALLDVLVSAGQALTHEDPVAAEPLLLEALALVRARDDLANEAVVSGLLGIRAIQTGEIDAAHRWCEAGLALHRQTGSRRHEGMMLGRLAIVAARRGELVRSAQLFEQALPIAVETGVLLDEAYWRANLGEMYVELGRPAEALPHAEAAVQIASEIRVTATEAQARAQLGNVLVALGREREGIAQIERGAELVIESGAPRMAAQYLLAAPDTGDRAMERLERALALAVDPVTEATASCRRAKLLVGSRPEEARAALERALQAAGRADLVLPELERLLAEARLALGWS
jgi:tetratricopeptide (TPR) repeat protein